jgi:hypothetical protein
MFLVELKPAPNNNNIFNVEYVEQCKIKFVLSKLKRDIAQCANCRLGTPKIIATSNLDAPNVQVTT